MLDPYYTDSATYYAEHGYPLTPPWDYSLADAGNAYTLFALLIAAHFIIDFPLQGDTVAREKNPNSTSELQKHVPWPYWMFAHAVMHATAVGYITALWSCAAFELVTHFAIDWYKCKHPRFTIHHDQLAHLVVKIVMMAFLLHRVMLRPL